MIATLSTFPYLERAIIFADECTKETMSITFRDMNSKKPSTVNKYDILFSLEIRISGFALNPNYSFGH
jgi:hypothetical protein